MDLHASARFYGKDPIARVEGAAERSEAMRKRMKKFGRVHEGAITVSKEVHRTNTITILKDLASPVYLRGTDRKAHPLIFMCKLCDWAFLDGSRSSTGRIHICPQDSGNQKAIYVIQPLKFDHFVYHFVYHFLSDLGV